MYCANRLNELGGSSYREGHKHKGESLICVILVIRAVSEGWDIHRREVMLALCPIYCICTVLNGITGAIITSKITVAKQSYLCSHSFFLCEV